MINKKSEFDSTDQRLSSFAKALSHPARIAIIRYLAQNRNCLCGEIVDTLPLAQSTVSQHLKELQIAGIVSNFSESPKSCYCLETGEFEKLRQEMSRFLKDIEVLNQLNCC